MDKKEEYILNQVKQIVEDKEPNAKIFFYGSRIKGTHKKDSDWDFLILLDKEIISDAISKNITSSLYDLEFEIGEVISPIIFTQNDWNTKYKVTQFYKNVMSEGKVL